MLDNSKKIYYLLENDVAHLDYFSWRNSEFERINYQLEKEYKFLQNSIQDYVKNQSSLENVITGKDCEDFLPKILLPWTKKQIEKCKGFTESSFYVLHTRIKANSKVGSKLDFLPTKSMPNRLNVGLIGELPGTLSFGTMTEATLKCFIALTKTLPLETVRPDVLVQTGYTGILEEEILTIIFGNPQKAERGCLLNILQTTITLSAENKLREGTSSLDN